MAALLAATTLAGTVMAATVLRLQPDTVAENEDLMTLVGHLSVEGLAAPADRFELVEDGSGESRLFRIKGDALYTWRSFDYEHATSHVIVIRATVGDSEVVGRVRVNVADVSGKMDEDGIADAEVAAKYPQVQVGDYVVFNRNRDNTVVLAPTDDIYPHKLLIKGGDYSAVRIDFAKIRSATLERHFVVTNFLGQVKSDGLFLRNGSNWRVTGQYDPHAGTGSRYFPGCDSPGSDVDFRFSSGKFGIWSSHKWKDEDQSLLYAGGAATGFELDHIELSDGGFAGAMIKHDKSLTDMDDVHVHHMYIHDTGSEGVYLGSTQPEPQHLFNRLHFERNLVVRTGTEAIQLGRLGAGCVIEHNVVWGALDWLSPFSWWQDNSVQFDARQGGTVFSHNIVLGGAGHSAILNNTGRPDIKPNGEPLAFEWNLHWGSRAAAGLGVLARTDGVTPWIFRHNYWGDSHFDYDRAYAGVSAADFFMDVAAPQVPVTIEDNVFDRSRRQLYHAAPGVHVKAHGNRQSDVPAPDFRDFTGLPGCADPFLWSRWTATVGEDPRFGAEGTRKGEAVVWQPGEIVQHPVHGETRFFRCRRATSNPLEPQENPDDWELLSWDNNGHVSFIPPDDARLAPGSFYRQLGIGLEDGEGTAAGGMAGKPAPR